MRILFLTHAFNSLTQRLWVELTAAGHDVSVEFDVNDRVTAEAVALWKPELVVAPFLKRRIPESVWRRHRCIVIHPGVRGDRGPSALDWAIVDGETEWGVTALEANGEMDAGDVWASVGFPMRDATKSSLYRNEVTEAAVAALRLALAKIAAGGKPEPLAAAPRSAGRLRPLMRQADRAIDWRRDDTATVLRKIRAADGAPGVRDEVLGERVHLFDAHPEGRLTRRGAGAVVAQRDGAICRATVDGAVWITHLKRIGGRRAAVQAAGGAGCSARPARRRAGGPARPGCRRRLPDVAADPLRGIGRRRLSALPVPQRRDGHGAVRGAVRGPALRASRGRRASSCSPGGPDFWSNGIHLNLIEAADHPAEESWRNINAMDDLVREIIVTDRQLTIAAMQGNAGAGGVFLALAADRVFARDGVILNPHYKGWATSTARSTGRTCCRAASAPEQVRAVTGTASRSGVAAGGCDGAHRRPFRRNAGGVPSPRSRRGRARLPRTPDFDRMLAGEECAPRGGRGGEAARRPTAREELERMKLNFFGFDPSYHVARYHFVCKVPRSRTPLWLARHRTARATVRRAAAD